MAELKFEIMETVGTLSHAESGWAKSLNLISWNEREPVYDIRSWSEDQSKMGKGVTMTLAELKELRKILDAYLDGHNETEK